MVNILSPDLDQLFYALSDPTRRQLLRMLNEGTRTVTELAEPFKISLAAVSKHIKILESAKLLNRKVQGRVHTCSINPEALRTAEECIQFYTQFWTERLDAFAESLESETQNKKKKE